MTWDHKDPIVCGWCQIGETKEMSRAQLQEALQLENKREMQCFCHSIGCGVNTIHRIWETLHQACQVISLLTILFT